MTKPQTSLGGWESLPSRALSLSPQARHRRYINLVVWHHARSQGVVHSGARNYCAN